MKYLLLSTCVLLLFACQKEYSVESGLNTNVKPEGCLVESIQRKTGDDVTGAITMTYLKNFSIAQIEDKELPDGPLVDKIDFQYEASNKVAISPDEYYVLDPTNLFRVKEHHVRQSYEINGSTQKVDNVYVYNYDASGALVSKVLIFQNVEVYRYDYTWTSGNLTKIVKTVAQSGDLAFSATLTYYTDSRVKDFINLQLEDLPSLVALGLNLGKKSINAVKSIDIEGSIAGIPVSGGLTTFTNYVVNPEGQVTSFEVDGSLLEGYGIYKGTNELKYMCP